MDGINNKKKGIFWLILMFLPLIIFLIFQIIKCNKELKDYETVCARVYKVSYNAPKGTTTRQNSARYIYNYKGEKYNKGSEFYSFDVKEGDFFKVKVSKENPSTHDVDFSEKYDSCEEAVEDK